MSINAAYVALIMRSKEFTMMDSQIGEDHIVYTLPGKTFAQSRQWNLPVIVSPLFERTLPAECSIMARWKGSQYELYGNANDVAGLGELAVDRRKAEIPALW